MNDTARPFRSNHTTVVRATLVYKQQAALVSRRIPLLTQVRTVRLDTLGQGSARGTADGGSGGSSLGVQILLMAQRKAFYAHSHNARPASASKNRMARENYFETRGAYKFTTSATTVQRLYRLTLLGLDTVAWISFRFEGERGGGKRYIRLLCRAPARRRARGQQNVSYICRYISKRTVHIAICTVQP